jgi:hypothetical protein
MTILHYTPNLHCPLKFKKKTIPNRSTTTILKPELYNLHFEQNCIFDQFTIQHQTQVPKTQILMHAGRAAGTRKTQIIKALKHSTSKNSYYMVYNSLNFSWQIFVPLNSPKIQIPLITPALYSLQICPYIPTTRWIILWPLYYCICHRHCLWHFTITFSLQCFAMQIHLHNCFSLSAMTSFLTHFATAHLSSSSIIFL